MLQWIWPEQQTTSDVQNALRSLEDISCNGARVRLEKVKTSLRRQLIRAYMCWCVLHVPTVEISTPVIDYAI